MSFFSKMQNALANWMQGRNGPDNLAHTRSSPLSFSVCFRCSACR